MPIVDALHRRICAPLLARLHRRQVLAAELPRRDARPHGLPAPLVVSLTSYRPRFGNLALTLRSLLRQTVRPDAILLWIGHADADAVPEEVRALCVHGVRIRTCEDLRCYTKLIPALVEDPERYIVTVDDDTYYRPELLAELVEAVPRFPGCVVCQRAHRIALDPDGRVRPYAEWTWNVPAGPPAIDLLATGMGGVLYQPGVLDPQVTDRAVFRELSPAADDLWLYMMARLRGSRVVKIGPARRYHDWGAHPGGGALWKENVREGRNDTQFARLVERFGVLYR